jgi:hypothetical protein
VTERVRGVTVRLFKSGIERVSYLVTSEKSDKTTVNDRNSVTASEGLTQ